MVLPTVVNFQLWLGMHVWAMYMEMDGLWSICAGGNTLS